MSKITRQDVLKLARLSRLKLTSEEVEQFTGEFNEIIGYVEVLNTVDTSGLEPTYQVTGLKNVTREDTVKDYGVTPETLLKNAPAVSGGQFKVKKIL